MKPERIAEAAWKLKNSVPDVSAMAEERLRNLTPLDIECLLRWSHESQRSAARANANRGCLVVTALILGGLTASIPLLVGERSATAMLGSMPGILLLLFGVALNRTIRRWQPD